MSRAKIGIAVAILVAVLTGAAYTLATRRLEAQIARDVEARVSRAEDLFTQIGAVESLNLITRAQEFARDDALAKALAPGAPAGSRDQLSDQGIQRFLGALAQAPRPDFVAVLDGKGAVVRATAPMPDSDDLKGMKSVAAALDSGQVSKDIWDYGKRLVRVGVAPIVDPQSGARLGAVLLGYALTNKEASEAGHKLGADVVFFTGDRIVATSFARSPISDLKGQPQLAQLAADALAGKNPSPVSVDIGGETWIVDAGSLPLNFSDRTTGAMVFESLAGALEPVGTVRITILLLGLGALIVALFTMVVTTRLILHQSEEIEAGVNEIINGDIEFSFKPVGNDLDGLASALNVMLARILGRPEPGDEPLDDGTGTGKVVLEEEAATRAASDAETLALASEPEADYYRRVYEEYISARKAANESVESVTYESFTAKLRLSEASLKKKYSCKAVRFRVVAKGNQVSLKPVPIL